MNFAHALAALDVAERDRQIAAEIAAHDWLDHVAKHMQHGGWPEVATPRVLRIEDVDGEIRVRMLLDYTELCPQGCNAYPRRFVETVVVQLAIDGHNGYHVVCGEQPN